MNIRADGIESYVANGYSLALSGATEEATVYYAATGGPPVPGSDFLHVNPVGVPITNHWTVLATVPIANDGPHNDGPGPSRRDEIFYFRVWVAQKSPQGQVTFGDGQRATVTILDIL